MDLIMRKHIVEEGGERRDQAGPKGVNEEGDLGGRSVDASTRRRPSHRLSPFIEVGGKHGTHLAHSLIVEHQRSTNCGLDGRRCTSRRQRFVPLIRLFRRHGDGVTRAQVRLERGAESRGSRRIGEVWRGRWKNNCVGCGGRIARRIPRQLAEAETPTSNQPPRVDRGRRLLGSTALHTCPLASPRSQARARLGPGGYCRCPGNGGPQTCLPAANGVALQAGPYGPSSSTSTQDPHEGPSLARRTTQYLHRSGLTRLAREGWRDQGQTNLARSQ